MTAPDGQFILNPQTETYLSMSQVEGFALGTYGPTTGLMLGATWPASGAPIGSDDIDTLIGAVADGGWLTSPPNITITVQDGRGYGHPGEYRWAIEYDHDITEPPGIVAQDTWSDWAAIGGRTQHQTGAPLAMLILTEAVAAANVLVAELGPAQS